MVNLCSGCGRMILFLDDSDYIGFKPVLEELHEKGKIEFNVRETQEVDYEYYIIEVDKEYRIKKNERISSTFNRTSFYSEFSNNYRLDIYLFKKNNEKRILSVIILFFI